MTAPPTLEMTHPPANAGASGWRQRLARGENLVLTFMLAAMVLLPLLEILLRKVFQTGLSGSTQFVQHLTLIVGMLGGAIAAREGRLLSVGSLDMLIKGRARLLARGVSHSVAGVVAVFLVVATLQFVQAEKGAGKTMAYGIPAWVIQLVLPIGFALVAIRIFWRAAEKWKWRVAVILLAGVLIWIGVHPPLPRDQLVLPALVLLLVATAVGGPIFAALGGAALILFWGAEVPIAAISVDHYRLVTNATLPSVPLFTLAGYLLAEGGAPRRLIRVFQALVGQFRGGPALMVAFVCAFFTSFTGASGVTILALGGLLMPVLLQAGYSEKNALGLLTGTGSLGLLFPPCLPLILYAVIAGVEIKEMFLGGFLPGILLVAMTAVWGIRQSPPSAEARQSFDFTEARRAIWAAKWELLIPVVAFAGLFSGLATAVEAAALTAFYTFVVETFVHRDLSIRRDLPRLMTECGLLVGGVLLILGVALGFTNYLVDAQVPTRMVEWVTASIHSPLVFLLLLNLLLILVGALMDIYSAIFVVVPLIVPLGHAFGIDPVHLGVIFLANAELGYLMPPVGENLFLASYRFGKPVSEVFRAVIPMMVVFLIATLLVTYVPALTTTLPRWVSR